MKGSGLRSEHSRHWGLDPEVVFLNHGSFGACPLEVLAEQDRLRRRMEAEPVLFLGREIDQHLDAARERLGEFLHADPADLAFVPNATAGVNTVLRSLRLAPGDRVVVTDHEYNATRNALDYAARASEVEVRTVRVPFPLRSADEVVEAVTAAVDERTRLVVIDHVTSPTGLVLPVERVVRAVAGRGVDVLVDGAHAPGMLDLDLAALGASFYTGNCHKWLCTPKGSAFLHVRPDRQEAIAPLALSHGYNSPRTDRSRFRLLFDWTGTDDPTPWLCIPAAIDFLGRLWPGGWKELRERNRAMALEARRVLARALEVELPAPDDMIGSLAALPLPPGTGPFPGGGDPLQAALFAEHGIEVPVMWWPAWPARVIRIAAQAYNSMAEFELLAAALVAARRRGSPR